MSLENEYRVFRHFISRDKWKFKRNNKINKDFAAFCSGGLDSSLLAAIFGIKNLYIAECDGGESEVKYAKMVAKHLKAKLRVVRVSLKDYKACMKKLVERKKEPLHPNEPCLYLIAKEMVKDGFDVAISGEGADDFFGGYTDLIENEKKYMNDKKTFLKRYAYEYVNIDIPFDEIKKKGMRQFIIDYHTPGLIQRVRNACDVAGIYCHFPYLNSLCIELALLFSDFGKTKLKEVAKNYLPEEIINRKKVGFPIPMDKWFGSYKKFLEYNLKLWKNIK